MTFVKAQHGDTSDSLIRKFIRKVINTGLLNDMRKREFYQKPSEVRKQQKQELKKRFKRRRRNP